MHLNSTVFELLVLTLYSKYVVQYYLQMTKYKQYLLDNPKISKHPFRIVCSRSKIMHANSQLSIATEGFLGVMENNCIFHIIIPPVWMITKFQPQTMNELKTFASTITALSLLILCTFAVPMCQVKQENKEQGSRNLPKLSHVFLCAFYQKPWLKMESLKEMHLRISLE